MRHLIGVFLAVAVSAAIFFGGGWGLRHLSALGNHLAAAASIPGLLALCAVLGTGILLGVLLAVPAVSPLATGLPGLGLMGWTALMLARPHLAVGWLPMPGLTAVAGFKSVLSSGVLALVGTAMLVPLAMPSRWRGRHPDDSNDDDDVTLPAATGLLT